MSTVAEHLRGLHERAGRDYDLLAENHRAIAARHRRIAEIHREAHRATGTPESAHSQLALEHEALGENHETLAKRLAEHGAYHASMKIESAKAAAAVDLAKAGRGDDGLVPSRVSAIGAIPPGLRLIERTGHVGAREATNDSPVAPQLKKILALDDE
jgi:hypothetical protein